MRGFLAIASVALLTACGSDSSDPKASGGTGGTVATGGTGGGAGDGGGTGGAAGAAPCSEDPSTIPPGAECVLSVSGNVVDGADKPVSGLSMSVCGAICWYGTSEANGDFTVLIGSHILPGQFSTLVHGRPTRTTFYWPLPTTAKDQVQVGQLTTLDLPAPGVALIAKTDKQGAPAQTLVEGDVTLDVPAGVQIRLDVEDVALAGPSRLYRAFPIPSEKRDRFVDASLGLVQLYAFTPFEAAFTSEATGERAKVRLTVKNVTSLAAGTVVEFLALGSYLFDNWVKPATFEVVATGKVSADATTIDMDAGQGVEYLTWVGVRKKP